MVGHGVVELSCIFIAGGAGLLIGSAMIMPGDLTRADALKTRGMEAVRLMIGVAILLVVAGTIEGFISPAPIDPRIKYRYRGDNGSSDVFLPAARRARQLKHKIYKIFQDLQDLLILKNLVNPVYNRPRSLTRK